MKTTWETPRILVQEFEANEYVAACYTVGCEIGRGNREFARSGNGGYLFDKLGKYSGFSEYNYPSNGDGMPHGDPCGNHTEFRDNGVMFESGKGSTGSIVGYIDKNSDDKLSDGDYLYWTTIDVNGTGTYHHFGTVHSASTAHPNRS